MANRHAAPTIPLGMCVDSSECEALALWTFAC